MKNFIAKDGNNILGTYKRLPVCFVRAEGEYLFDDQGNKYLDFLTGISVSVYGHNNLKINDAIKEQVEKLIHVSNLFYTESQISLAEKLNGFYGGGSKIFFVNSGAEANECAIKLARKYQENQYEIITFDNSFHGRTLATLTATGQRKVQQGFDPLPDGFKYAVFNDLNSVKQAVTAKTVAVMLELIQGEGGVHIADKQFVKDLSAFCEEKGLLLIVDEIQTGIGRTGKIFAYEHYGIKPDIVTLAKALGAGLPLGAVIVNDKYKNIFGYGAHGSTFGGNIVACSAALAGLEQLTAEQLSYINEMGAYFKSRLKEITDNVRGLGLMIAMEPKTMPDDLVGQALKEGFIINIVQDKTIRFLPSYFVSKESIDALVEFLKSAINR